MTRLNLKLTGTIIYIVVKMTDLKSFSPCLKTKMLFLTHFLPAHEIHMREKLKKSRLTIL